MKVAPLVAAARAARSLVAAALAAVIVAGAGAAFPSPAHGATVAPPAHLGELARLSDAVVYAEVIAAGETGEAGEVSGAVPHTLTPFVVREVVAGGDLAPGDLFEVAEPGGGLPDGRRVIVPGAAVYEPGGRYLLFLARGDDGGPWRSRVLSYGTLREDASGKELRPLPDAAAPVGVPGKGFEPVAPAYRRGELVRHLRAVAAGVERWEGKRVALRRPAAGGELAAATAGAASPGLGACRYLDSGGTRFRAFEPLGIIATPAQPGDHFGLGRGLANELVRAVAAWVHDPGSAVAYTVGAGGDVFAEREARISCAPETFDYDAGAVVLGDPCNDLADVRPRPGDNGTAPRCIGVLAFASLVAGEDGTRTFNGEEWFPIEAPFVVVNGGADVCLGEWYFAEMLSHEIGHTLGFDHHTAADSLMSTVRFTDPNRGAVLSPGDSACAAQLYPNPVSPTLAAPPAGVPLFSDVPPGHWAQGAVERAALEGITAGCGWGRFCGDQVVTRAQWAVLLMQALNPRGWNPRAPSSNADGFSAFPFPDVSLMDWAAPWIFEYSFRQGRYRLDGINYYAAGAGMALDLDPCFVPVWAPEGACTVCGSWCPDRGIRRYDLAVEMLRAKFGPSYVPPPATGGVFRDIDGLPEGSRAFIEDLARKGLTAGCGNGNYCPYREVTRAEIASFLLTLRDGL